MGTSLWSGKYSVPPTELEKKLEGEEFQKGIRPAIFKTLVGKNHSDFSGKLQRLCVSHLPAEKPPSPGSKTPSVTLMRAEEWFSVVTFVFCVFR